MKSIWIGVIGACALAFSAQAQTVSRIEIFDAGIYSIQLGEKIDAPGAVTGKTQIVRNPVLVERTTRIPARIGMNFGFNFHVLGQPENGTVTLRQVVRFPPGGVRNPKTGKVHEVSEVDRPSIIGGVRYRGYSFDEEWETVPGKWVFEFWYEGKMIASQTFEVVKQ